MCLTSPNIQKRTKTTPQRSSAMHRLLLLLWWSGCSIAFFGPSVRTSTSRASDSCSSSSAQLREEYSPRCEWVSPALNTSNRVMQTYFEVELRPEQSCEIFLVEGVPAASMVFDRIDEHGAPLVEAFHLNKAMLLLFDAASHMRRLLCRRYESLDLQHATNRDEFLFLP